MRWTAVIVGCLSHLTLSQPDNSLVNSATRKFFFADSHENIDEKQDVAGHHDDAESLPFGKLSDNMSAQYRLSPELTIEQFINKLKRIKKTKQKQPGGPGQSRNKSATKTKLPKQRKPSVSQRPARVKSKQANIPLPGGGTTNDKKITTSASGGVRKTTGRPPTSSRHRPAASKDLKKGPTKADIKIQKQAKNEFITRKPSPDAKGRVN